MRLVVGLGNPGPEYAQTRHNAGFMVLDRLASEFRADSFRRETRHDAEVTSAMLPSCGKVWLCKPLTYMNVSGKSVSSLCNFYQIRPEEILVVADDYALPLGKLRLREKGSSGGHNGLESVTEHLGTSNWPRLRIGIGPLPPRWNSADFVLARFAPDERALLEQVIPAGADAVVAVGRDGMAAAMNRFNPLDLRPSEGVNQ